MIKWLRRDDVGEPHAESIDGPFIETIGAHFDFIPRAAGYPLSECIDFLWRLALSVSPFHRFLDGRVDREAGQDKCRDDD